MSISFRRGSGQFRDKARHSGLLTSNNEEKAKYDSHAERHGSVSIQNGSRPICRADQGGNLRAQRSPTGVVSEKGGGLYRQSENGCNIFFNVFSRRIGGALGFFIR